MNNGMTYPDIVQMVSGYPKPKQIDQSSPLGLTPESLAREFEALGRALASLSASEYDGLSATGLARIADMASRCRRNVELLREECGR